MKSYTDLPQSKKLAEFLPIESADMRFCFSHTLGGRITGHYPMIGSEPSLGTIPCWSLAALLGVMPRIEHLKPYIDLSPKLDSEEVAIYYHSEDSPYIVKDNLIDACYEMIIKLHELNLL